MSTNPDRVAVAVSGGSDSVALAWWLHDRAARGEYAVAGMIHVNHGLRGAASDDDEAFCRALAARLGWPIDVTRVDVAARARARRQSLEVAAREARYEGFEAAADRLGATVVMTGHTADDQAETVLLRILRGAGTRGLSGIRARRGRFVRPFLSRRRADLRRDLEHRGEAWREDLSNADVSVPRNRLRHELMPVIERLSPSAVPALARLASLAADDEAFLEARAIESTGFVVLSRDGAATELDAAALAGLPAALGRRVVRAVAAALAPSVTLAERHIEAVRTLAAGRGGHGHLDLPGLAVECRKGRLVLRPASAGEPGAEEFELALPVPGTVDVPGAGVTVSAERAGGSGVVVESGRGEVATLQESSVAGPLVVRNRRPGDRYQPIGAPGRRKLQDVFVDRKIPRNERDRVPIVTDREGRILWVPGLGIAEVCRVTAPGAGVVILRVSRQ
jgi:tRNA(Ile)-lysidine synthase